MSGRATGIGGIFFRAENPEILAARYARPLGVTSFHFWPQDAGNAVFAPFISETDDWAPGKH